MLFSITGVFRTELPGVMTCKPKKSTFICIQKLADVKVTNGCANPETLRFELSWFDASV